MDLPEPSWRRALLADLAGSLQNPPVAGCRHRLKEAVQEHLVDHFDSLVQAIVRGDLATARGILGKHYPGSLERQVTIESELLGRGDT